MRLLSEMEFDTVTRKRSLWFPSFAKEGFESGALGDDWTVLEAVFEIKSDVAYDGSYSAGASGSTSTKNARMANWEPAVLSGGYQPTKFSFVWYETSSSTGGGLQVRDSDDALVCAFYTDNPEWHIESDAGNQQVDSGTGYEHWIYVEFEFDWTAGTFDYYIEDLSTNYSVSGTKDMISSKDVGVISLANFNTGSTTAIEMRYDDLTIWL